MSDLKWLPGDPMTFFELGQDFDRRDLKRAYGKAIRKYKPETHPSEFGMIREAYERLEKSLRYGQQIESMAQASEAWSPEQETPKDETPQLRKPQLSEPKPPQPEPTLRQLAVADPVAATAKLESTLRRSPQDYYLAAILSDAVSLRSTSKYLAHLIDGLTAYPDDPGLTALTTEFLRTEIPDALLGKSIQFVARKIATPLFYVLTESLWLRSIETTSFDEVRKLLDECERPIRQDDPSTRSTFQLRLMRSAIWVAPADWSSQILEDIEAQSATLNYTSQMDLQFLVDLQTLIRHRNVDDPVREKLLSAVRASCRYDETQSVAQVDQTLAEVARDSAAFRKSFPCESDNDDVAWASVIDSVVDQLDAYRGASLNSTPDSSVDENRLAAQTLQLIKDLVPDVNAVVHAVDQAKFRYKRLPMLLWLTILSIVGTLPLLMIIFLFDGGQGSGIVVLVMVTLLMATVVGSFFGWLYPKVLAPRQEKFKQTRLMRDYGKYWRARLFRFSQACGEPISMQCLRIGQMGHQTNQAGISDLVIHFIRQDTGLVVFATLQRVIA